MATKHLPAERFLAMVLWWKGLSAAEIARRAGFPTRACLQGVVRRETEGMPLRSVMSVEERQEILDRMKAEAPAGAVVLATDFVAFPLRDRQTACTRATVTRPPRPGRDGNPVELVERNRLKGTATWNAAVDQVEHLHSRGMLSDPQPRDAGDREVMASRWAGQRRFEMARMIQMLCERAGRETALSTIDHSKVTGAKAYHFDPTVNAFMARSDLAEIQSLMPPAYWQLLERLISPSGIPGLIPPRGSAKALKRDKNRAKSRRQVQEGVWLALDYVATWRKSGRAEGGRRNFPLLTGAEFAQRWPGVRLKVAA